MLKPTSAKPVGKERPGLSELSDYMFKHTCAHDNDGIMLRTRRGGNVMAPSFTQFISSGKPVLHTCKIG